MSDDKVVAFKGCALPTPRGEAVEGLVEILEDYLVDARSGRLLGVAIAGIIDDGTQTPLHKTSFKGVSGRAAMLESALRRLVRRYGAWMDEG